MRRTILILLLAALALSPQPLHSQGAGAPINAGPATLTTSSSGTCTATSCLSINLGGYTGVGVQVTGTCGTCTLIFEASIDGTNWVSQFMTPSAAGAVVTSTTTTGYWTGSIVGRSFRARLSAVSSGSFVVSIRVTPNGPGPNEYASPLQAGGGTATFRVGGTLYWQNPVTATTAGSTTWVTSTAFAIPANTLSTNGDALLAELEISATPATTNSKNYTCNVGYTSLDTSTGTFTGGLNLISSSTGTNAAFSVWAKGVATRLSATSTGLHMYAVFEGTSANQQAAYSTASGITWTNSNNFLCAVGNTTASNTTVITIQEVRLTWIPR